MNYSVVEIVIKIICDGFLVLCEARSVTGDLTSREVSSLGIKSTVGLSNNTE
jgi:hypothetical protein